MAKARPVYQKIYSDLHREISSGRYKPGALLPTEQELVEKYGVSRSPVRQALGRLEAEGAVLRRAGYGTEVLNPKVASIAPLSGFAHFYNERADEVSSRLLGLNQIPASEEVASHLGVPVGSSVMQLRRVRLLADEPIAYMLNHVSTALHLEESHEFFSLGGLFQSRRVVVQRAEETLLASPAPDEVADVLQVKPMSPVLEVTRLSWDGAQRPVAYTRYFVRSDRMPYKASILRWHRP